MSGDFGRFIWGYVEGIRKCLRTQPLEEAPVQTYDEMLTLFSALGKVRVEIKEEEIPEITAPTPDKDQCNAEINGTISRPNCGELTSCACLLRNSVHPCRKHQIQHEWRFNLEQESYRSLDTKEQTVLDQTPHSDEVQFLRPKRVRLEYEVTK